MEFRETRPLPGPDPSSKEKFLELMRSDRVVGYVDNLTYELLARIHFKIVPLGGNCSFLDPERDEDGKLTGIKKAGIFINMDYYQKRLSQDYSDVIPYEVEHEAQELYYAVKRGMSPRKISERLEHHETLGLPHYLAIRRTLEKAQREGMLDRYIEFKKEQLKTFDALGDTRAMKELSFYRRHAKKLKGKES